MIEYAKLTPGVGFSPVNSLLYYLQRIVQHRPMRGIVAKAIARSIAILHPMDIQDVADHPHQTSVISDLERDGYAILTPLVQDDALREILSFLETKEVVGPDAQRCLVSDLPIGTRTAPYPLETVLHCPHILALANHPMVLRVAAEYLGCKPTLSSIGIRWSYPTPHPATDVQRFHRDLDDWRTVKLFIYLTDVDQESGPHTYVAGSHRVPSPVFARSYSQAELIDQYGTSSLRSILGPRGTSFLADVYGIHCGMVPVNRPRLILQIQYSLLPIYAFRYVPMTVPQTNHTDMYINRLMIDPKGRDRHGV